MSSVVQSLVNGALIGCFYALIAVGFAMVLGVVRVFNIAHGEFMVIGAYVGYWLWSAHGVNPVLAIPAAMLLVAVVGWLTYRVIGRMGEPRGLNGLVVTFGLSILLQNAMIGAFAADYRLMASGRLGDSLVLGDIAIGYGRLIIALLSLAVIGALHWFLNGTYLGHVMRATTQDRDGAMLMGINVERVDIWAFTLGAALAGMAGPLFAAMNYVHPAAGRPATVIAIILTILGGVGQVRGLLIGGVLLGLLEAATLLAFGPQWREPVFFIVLLALMAARPRGLVRGLAT
ncbi:MAG: branched-chain amino acid ABC transporter permease [Anaerolineae bacterium]